MTRSSREPGLPPSRSTRHVAVVLAIFVACLYPLGYVGARVSHRLVNYGGPLIQRGGQFDVHTFAFHRDGPSGDEILFAPCIWLEQAVRRALDIR